MHEILDVSIALTCLLAIAVGGQASAPRRRDHLHPTAAWVLACQNENGGFGAFPGDIPAVRPTAWAVQALSDLGVAIPRREAIAQFAASRQNEDGGFLGRPWGLRWTDQSTLVNSSHAVRALQALGAPVPRPAALARFVHSCQRDDGPFAEPFGPEPAGLCREIWFALDILRTLGTEIPRRAKLITFLRKMQLEGIRGDGGFMLGDVPSWGTVAEAERAKAARAQSYLDPGSEDTRAIPVSVGYVSATHYAVRALALLGGSPARPNPAIDFLCAQRHASGGFVTGMGDYGAYHDRSEGRMADTCQALSGLRTLADLGSDDGGAAGWDEFLTSGRVDVEGCAAWIACCQNSDGGFARWPDATSRPSDMEATSHALRALSLLGRPVPRPAAPAPARREQLPPEVEFALSSAFFQPCQPGQGLYLHRIVAPIRAARKTDEGTALALMRWVNQHMAFGVNPRNEAGLLIEDAFGACGPQARALIGLLEAAGIPGRFLMVDGHCTAEGLIDGRWCLLDAMFDGAFRGDDGRLCSALDIHERHAQRMPDATTFGDWRYRGYTIYWPQGGADEEEITIGPEDDADSPAVCRAYPELKREAGS